MPRTPSASHTRTSSSGSASLPQQMATVGQAHTKGGTDGGRAQAVSAHEEEKMLLKTDTF